MTNGGPIRVLVVSHTIHQWGAEQRMLDTARRLSADGFEMTLAAPAEADLARSWAAAGLQHLPYEAPPREGLRRGEGDERRPSLGVLAREAAVTTAACRRLVRLAGRADIVHSHSLTANLDVALAARVARKRAVLDVHDIVRPGVGRMVLSMGAVVADATIANSRATEGTIRGPVRRLTVIPPGVDTEVFHPGSPDAAVRGELASRPDLPLVGIVGRVDPEKGIATVVDAVQRLVESGTEINVAVVGDSTQRNEAWARQLRADAQARLGERARFVGARRDVPAVLRTLDVLVNASDCEPFGRSVLEAQACGTPVIGTQAGGIPEFVEDGRTGLLVAPRDPAALAEAIKEMLSNQERRRRLVANALEQVEGSYSAVAHASAVGDLYRSVVFGLAPSESGRARVFRHAVRMTRLSS